MWQRAIIYAQAVSGEGAGAEGQSQGPGLSGSLLFMLVIFGIMWFLLILPNQRRDKKRKELLASLSKGDKVVTMGGICGTIVGLDDSTVVVKVSDNPVLKMEFVRSSISQKSNGDKGEEKK